MAPGELATAVLAALLAKRCAVAAAAGRHSCRCCRGWGWWLLLPQQGVRHVKCRLHVTCLPLAVLCCLPRHTNSRPTLWNSPDIGLNSFRVEGAEILGGLLTVEHIHGFSRHLSARSQLAEAVQQQPALHLAAVWADAGYAVRLPDVCPNLALYVLQLQGAGRQHKDGQRIGIASKAGSTRKDMSGQRMGIAPITPKAWTLKATQPRWSELSLACVRGSVHARLLLSAIHARLCACMPACASLVGWVFALRLLVSQLRHACCSSVHTYAPR